WPPMVGDPGDSNYRRRWLKPQTRLWSLNDHVDDPLAQAEHEILHSPALRAFTALMRRGHRNQLFRDGLCDWRAGEHLNPQPLSVWVYLEEYVAIIRRDDHVCTPETQVEFA